MTTVDELIRQELDRLGDDGKLLAALYEAVTMIHQLELRTERAHGDRWQALAAAYDEIRYELRLQPDTDDGHAAFYHEAARIIFGDNKQGDGDGHV